MNNEIQNPSVVEEDVDVGLANKTVDIKLKLKMKKDAPDASFNYKVDIDEVGQIILTPEDTTTSFIEASRSTSNEVDQETDTEKSFTLTLTADMLCDNEAQLDSSWEVNIDDVGQAVLTPTIDKVSFLTVSVKDSLNLITEETQENNKESEGDQEGESTEETSELKVDESEPEPEVQETPAETTLEDKIEDTVDNVKATVKESLTFSEVLNTLVESTKKFTQTKGGLKTGYITEALFTQKILEKYYNKVIRESNDDWTLIHYEDRKGIALTEDIDPNSEEFVNKREMAEELIDNLESSLRDAIEYLNGIESLFEEIGIHSADIPGYFTNYIDNFIESDREISCSEFRNRLEEYANGEA